MKNIPKDISVKGLGESYIKEFLEKLNSFNLEEQINWHFIGQLQSNKVKLLVGHQIALFQSVDRESLIFELGKHFPGNNILLQLDITGDPARGGAKATEIPHLMELAVKNSLNPIGIMLIARTGVAESIEDFKLAYKIKQDLGLPILSAGMSQDYELAVGEGSNMVRLGTAIFK